LNGNNKYSLISSPDFGEDEPIEEKTEVPPSETDKPAEPKTRDSNEVDLNIHEKEKAKFNGFKEKVKESDDEELKKLMAELERAEEESRKAQEQYDSFIKDNPMKDWGTFSNKENPEEADNEEAVEIETKETEGKDKETEDSETNDNETENVGTHESVDEELRQLQEDLKRAEEEMKKAEESQVDESEKQESESSGKEEL